MTEPLFEFIDEAEYEAATAAPEPRPTKRSSKYDLSIRTKTAWFQLPHQEGTCTVPTHEAVQSTLSSDELAYRERYPVRMVFTIEPYVVCRDCFLAEADVECSKEGLAPLAQQH